MILPKRSEIRPGMRVRVVEKQNQGSGLLTEGVVRRILTSSPTHPHGIKVMLEDGRVACAGDCCTAQRKASMGRSGAVKTGSCLISQFRI